MPILGKVACDRTCGPTSQLHAEPVGKGACAPTLVMGCELPWKGFAGGRLAMDGSKCGAKQISPKVTLHVPTGFVIQHNVLIRAA